MPGPKAILSGPHGRIWRRFTIYTITLPTPFDVGPINVYVLEGPLLTLVDTGAKTSRTMSELRQGLAAHGHRIADIRQIIITHAHADHFGLAAEIVAESGAQVLTHSRNYDRLTDYRYDFGRRYDFYRDIFRQSGLSDELAEQVRQAAAARVHFADSVSVARLLEEGDKLDLDGAEWQVLFTPGHAGGLICLHQAETRQILSSDHLLKHITSNPVLEAPSRGETTRRRSLVEYLASLRRIAAMDLTLALPSHGPAIRDPGALVHERLHFHERRQSRILALLDGEGRTAYQLAQSLWPSLATNRIFLGLSEIIGNLDVLEDEGRVVQVPQDDRILYRRA
jgi:glyoxylase-like metal-dependent hydrolase (beta-lactamase superfamily II)